MKTIKDYLKEFSFSLSDEKQEMLNEWQTKEILNEALLNYKKRSITIQELSSVAGDLYYAYNNPHVVNTQYSNVLCSMLSELSDITYGDNLEEKEELLRESIEEYLR